MVDDHLDFGMGISHFVFIYRSIVQGLQYDYE